MFRILRNSVRVPFLLVCTQCGATMKAISFFTDFAVVSRIIAHLNLSFVADRPPPPGIVYQGLKIAAETPAEYFSSSSL